MSSEHNDSNPSSNPNIQGRQPSPELWGPWGLDDDDTQPQQAIQSPAPPSSSGPGLHQFGAKGSLEGQSPGADPQFAYREHVTGTLPGYPVGPTPAYAPYPPFQGYRPPQAPVSAHPPQPEAHVPGYPAQRQSFPPAQQPGYPTQQPAYPPPPYPGHQGYYPYSPYPPYPGYPPYASYAWQAPKPKRDGYLFGIAITSFIGSILVLLAGLGSLLVLALFAALPPNASLSPSDYFAGEAFFVALTGAGLLGGSFSLYHSIRSLFLRKPSRDFALPRFWIFVIFYLLVLGFGFLLQAQGAAVRFPVLTLALIILAGLLPALALLALGVRRLRARLDGKSLWPTTWRRFTVAIVSGATASILLALILESILQIVILHGQNASILLCIDRPDGASCQAPGVYGLLFVLVAVVAPVVEETVKPLAVVFLVTKLRSAAEAFVLGLACGIGFDLIETTGYISSGYQDWLSVALIRTSAGLLHGFGAAMVALGWYYLVHAQKRRFLLASACWLYAVLQHALWNGSWGLALLPAPIGPAIDNWNVNLGFTTLPFYLVINLIEALFMLGFFIYMTGRLRVKIPPADSAPRGQAERSMQGQQQVAVST